MEQEKRIALLIDGDCSLHGYYDDIITKVSSYGKCYIKRIYGDFSKPQVAPWREVAKENSLGLVDVINYTTGKNSTDSALIIDAMELLLTDKFDLLYIVSGDSDYIRLIQRIKEEGKEVYAFGLEKSTHSHFITACDKFDTIDNKSDETNGPIKKLSEKSIIEILLIGLSNTIKDDGSANLGEMKKYIHKIRPSFEHNGSFSKYIESFAEFKLVSSRNNVALNEKNFLIWVYNQTKSKNKKLALSSFRNNITQLFKPYDYPGTFSSHLKKLNIFEIKDNIVTLKK